ncbi:MAG: hypothetical protein MI757_23265, partial [Pirellulales bacterium]|nr:hypothetical protein [Pirellulales bacterium]
MSDLHADHDHQHGPDCEHTGVQHGDHVDYLHDGHMHHVRSDGQIAEHALEVNEPNPADCTPGHKCG